LSSHLVSIVKKSFLVVRIIKIWCDNVNSLGPEKSFDLKADQTESRDQCLPI
jgi:hypothetical protein